MAPTDPLQSACDHRCAWDAIPWFVAGSASADLRALIARHLPHCDECRAELAFQQQVHAGLHAGAPAVLPSPEPGLQRLLARLDIADSAGHHHISGAPAPAPIAAAAPRAASNWTRWLAAAVLVQAVGLGGAGVALLDRSRGAAGDRVDAASYRTLTLPAAPTATAATVRLVPAPNLDFGSLRQLLAQTRLAVVDAERDGSSLGLAPIDGNPRTADAALPLLRAQPGVLLAEPTGR